MARKILVITISDTCSRDPSKDLSGPTLVEEAKKAFPNSMIEAKILPDELDQITKTLEYYSEKKAFDAIFTTGGTGFGPRDVTPEATKAVIHREAPAITEFMTIESLKYTPMAILSRAVAGIRNKTLIINFPGSVNAVKQCFNSISLTLPHAISLIKDEKSSVNKVHDEMKASEHVCPHVIGKSNVDISKVALRQRESPYPMLQVSDALKIVENAMIGLVKKCVAKKPLAECLGRVLATDVHAADPLPPFPASIKDGYACIAADGAGVRRVRGAVCAGDVSGEPLSPGECVRINTGAPLPPGADCVVQVEDTKLLKSSEDARTEYEIKILKAPKLAEDVRPVGHDIRQGELVVKEGTPLDAGNIGILATVGVVNVPVYLPPIVGLLSTGNELQNPADEVLLPGHIRDSNKIMLVSLFKEYGFDVIDCGISKDDPFSMKNAIGSALDRVDVLVSTGSVSMGERDILKVVLTTDFNATIHFGRINMKPGKPTTFATCTYNAKEKHIFGLPGNPVSAYVSSLLFAVPALRRCSGLESAWVELPVTLGTPVKLDPRPEYARATLIFDGKPHPTVNLTGSQCSSRLLSTCGAAVLVSLPGARDGLTELQRGATLTALLTTRLVPQ